MTSHYGQSNSREWFAEAFHDVYTKGSGAKQTSIEIVKEYEKRQTAKQKSNFSKKKVGWLKKVCSCSSRRAAAAYRTTMMISRSRFSGKKEAKK